ncbi:MAG: hypothetical protein ACRENP_11115 [Longimicrobiales bacterium]
MDRHRFLAWPAYLVAFTLVAVPFFDAMTQLGGFNIGNNQWRFGAVGLMSNAFMIPAAGLLIALATGLALQHQRFLRVFGYFSVAGAVLCGALLLLFTMDAVETRLNVQSAARFSFMVASFTAAAKLVLATLTFSGIARAGLRTKLDRAEGRSRSHQIQPTMAGGTATRA